MTVGRAGRNDGCADFRLGAHLAGCRQCHEKAPLAHSHPLRALVSVSGLGRMPDNIRYLYLHCSFEPSLSSSYPPRASSY
eukprot:scaffold246758_cov27-Tisochrysis_lutea.AAC.1